MKKYFVDIWIYRNDSEDSLDVGDFDTFEECEKAALDYIKQHRVWAVMGVHIMDNDTHKEVAAYDYDGSNHTLKSRKVSESLPARLPLLEEFQKEESKIMPQSEIDYWENLLNNPNTRITHSQRAFVGKVIATIKKTGKVSPKQMDILQRFYDGRLDQKDYIPKN